MKISLGRGFTHKPDDDHKVDVSIYEGKCFVEVNMSAWTEGKNPSLGFFDRKIIRWDLFLPRELSEKMYKRSLLRSQKKLNEDIKRRGNNLVVNMIN